jgi:hypothetical protein
MEISTLAPAARAQAAAPSISVTPNPVKLGSSATVTGTGFSANSWVYVAFQRPDGTQGGTFSYTGSAGALSFTLGFSESHGTGNEYVTAYDYRAARWVGQVTVNVFAGTPHPIRQLSAAPLTPTVGSATALGGAGFSANNWVYVYFQRPDGTTGAFWASATGSGSFTASLGFNASHGCGNETVWAYDYGTRAWSLPVTLSVIGCSGLAAPGNLRILTSSVGQTSAEPTTVTLQWQDNSTGETGFRIRSVQTRIYGDPSVGTQDVGANATTATLTYIAGGINPTKSLCFTVTAIGPSGESAPSNQTCLQLIVP